MKKSLALLNIIFVLALLFSAYTLYNAMAPILTGQVTIEMQDEDEIEWEFDNDTISAHTWVEIDNGGNYEIKDTKLHIWVIHRESGLKILDMEKTIPPVPAGTRHRENLDIFLDISKLPEDFKEDLWTKYANFTIYGEIGAYFMNRGGELLIHYHNTVMWEPLLKYIHVDSDNTTIYYDSDTGDMRIYIPYVVSTSSLLSGTAEVLIEIYNGTQVLSSTTEEVQLGEEYYDVMVFEVSASDTYYLMTHSMNIPVVATITHSGISMSFTDSYDWGAPFDNLEIGDIQSELNRIWIQYSYTNNYIRDLDITINTVVYDAAGNVIGSQDDNYVAYRYGNIDRQISVDVSGVPDHATITVIENVSGWHYTIRRDA